VFWVHNFEKSHSHGHDLGAALEHFTGWIVQHH
jgi:hypothetical protein